MSKHVFVLSNGARVSTKAEDRDVARYKLQRLGFKLRDGS